MNLVVAENAFEKAFYRYHLTEFVSQKISLRALLLTCFLSLISFGTIMYAQTQMCNVIAEPLRLDPSPDGVHDYFGVRVHLTVPYTGQNITVSGTIQGSSGTENWTLTIDEQTVAETRPNLVYTELGGTAVVTIESVDPCEITASYAGVNITYETAGGILRFNSASDFNAVVDQLEADYDSYNDNYDSQYPNLTPQQMDDVDAANNFDEFKPYKDFENLFNGFYSKRAEIEGVENTWISSGFTTTDPDDVDLTFDDALNTVFNSSNSFKIGSDTYQLTSDGLYINGVLQASVRSPFHSETADFASFKNGMLTNPFQDNWVSCKSNKKDKIFPQFNNQTERYKFKVSLTSVSIRSQVRVKVKHFTLKSNGHWANTRANMAVFLVGRTRNSLCNEVATFNHREPSPNGWKNRKQVKWYAWDTTIIWRAFSGDLGGSFDTEVGHSDSLLLTW
jgi:hypothetical protein